MIERIKDILFALLWFPAWIVIGKIDKDYDKWLRSKIKQKVKVEPINKYTVKFDNHEMWICNYPYGFGHIYRFDDYVPRRRTRHMLMKYLKSTVWKRPLDPDKKRLMEIINDR